MKRIKNNRKSINFVCVILCFIFGAILLITRSCNQRKEKDSVNAASQEEANGHEDEKKPDDTESKLQFRIKADDQDELQLTVLRSKNKGKTWDSYMLPKSCCLNDYEFTTLNEKETYLIVYGDAGMGTKLKGLYHTMDGGDSWTLQSGAYTQEDTMIQTMYYSYLNGISYGADGLVILSEDLRGKNTHAVIQCSYDYGVTWKELQIEVPYKEIMSEHQLTGSVEECYSEAEKAVIDDESIHIPLNIYIGENILPAEYVSGDQGENWQLICE